MACQFATPQQITKLKANIQGKLCFSNLFSNQRKILHFVNVWDGRVPASPTAMAKKIVCTYVFVTKNV